MIFLSRLMNSPGTMKLSCRQGQPKLLHSWVRHHVVVLGGLQTEIATSSSSSLPIRRFLHHPFGQQQQRTISSIIPRNSNNTLLSPVMMRSTALSNYHQPMAPLSSSTNVIWRSLSSNANQDSSGGDKETKKQTGSAEDEETKEIVLTPGEQVVAVTRLSMWAGIFVFACACAYYIGKELIPTKMSPNTVFNASSKVVKDDPQVIRQYGDSLKFYGKDHGGHREGRRNFIEHTQYTNEEDGSTRTRVRFNMEGQFASAFCFAEVSSAMPSGEFVYILVQDKQSGRVITVQDNRAAMTAQRLSGGSKETSDAMKQLLGGGSSK